MNLQKTLKKNSAFLMLYDRSIVGNYLFCDADV